MNAELPIQTETGLRRRPRWRRRLGVAFRRTGWVRFVEIGSLVALIAVIGISYVIATEAGRPDAPLNPETVAAMLVAILVPAMALMVMVARRLAIRRAARVEMAGRGGLHVRLVALFSVIASVPTLLVVIFASLLFQGGMQLWFSERAQTVIRNAQSVAGEYRQEQLDAVQLEVETMGGDVVGWLNERGVDDPEFGDFMVVQTARRYLLESALLTINSDGAIQMQGGVNLYDRPLEERFAAATLLELDAGEAIAKEEGGDRIEAIVRIDPEMPVYVYGARPVNARLLRLASDAQSAASDYERTLENSRNLQLRFNAILLLVSLLIVGIAIWIALKLADRLVRPVGHLVDAARRITAGDLSTRVPTEDMKDEVGTLGNAFNRMTGRLETQTRALVDANDQLDRRRAFTEAVLAGVTAGIVSVDGDHVVRLINRSAEDLLKVGAQSPVGQKLADLAPELDRQLSSEEREDVVQLASHGEPRTLAVKTVKVEGGHVLTFDDITEQLMDQRRAAWSDVARRIAHEIKNPLTPIQLAAERLQRRYGAEIASDPGTFERLTGTIVRQVGDLRRMVDEFSSFARMPKPAFAEEPVAEIARQALFLHEVAHPGIGFALDAPDPSPMLVCDRRLLGQALTNIVKNGVEAIQQKSEDAGEGEGAGAREGDRIDLTLRETETKLVIEVTDTGIGLPAERGRLTEPYMTTRAKGTGLGLAIVKKIVEEHFGQVEFADRAEGGSMVRLVFDREALARLGPEAGRHPHEPKNGG